MPPPRPIVAAWSRNANRAVKTEDRAQSILQRPNHETLPPSLQREATGSISRLVEEMRFERDAMETREDESRCSVRQGSRGPEERMDSSPHVSREREARR